MAFMRKLGVIVVNAALLLALVGVQTERSLVQAVQQAQATPSADELDRLLAPVALYPDQLLGQILQASQNPGPVEALNLFMTKNATLKGTALQDAASNAGFDANLVTLTLFPQVVKMMSDQLQWTTNIGVAFTNDRSAVFASIQRLRKKAKDVGTLKTTEQQEVETKTTSTGEQVIVIEPANPQVVYVPTYNTTTVYTQAPTTTTVIVQDDDNGAEAAAAGMIGFTAGIAIGAAFSSPYYYSPYGWYGGAYMYNDAWDDYYDHREDAREDWMDHREDMSEERSDRAENAREERTDRQENRQENRPEMSDQQRQQARDKAQANRSSGTSSTQSNRAAGTQQSATGNRAATAQANRSSSTTPSATTSSTRSTTPNAQTRGYSSGSTKTQSMERSSGSSSAFSGYSSGKSERSASQRGQSSRSSSSRSRSGGGGGRRR
jgi:hypothetical protein